MVRISHETVSGHSRGLDLTLQDFPLTIGRGPGAGLRLEEPGVWDEHAELRLRVGEGFLARSCGDALLVVNGQAVAEARLRNGDLLELGGARLRFGFADLHQRRFRIRERSTWVAIALLCLAQLVLVYLVLP